MRRFLKTILQKKTKYERIEIERSYEFIITEECVKAICDCIEPYKQKGHEGIAYLYGRTNGFTTLAIGAIRPDAYTTPGSIYVPSVEMARLVKKIRSNGLQLISQLHTHPSHAYHSDGDVEGLKLVCNGYVSVVLPDYGVYLPSFKKAAFYFYRRGEGFLDMKEKDVKIVTSRLL